MRVRVSAAGQVGWVGDGAYRYDQAQKNGAPWPPIPTGWSSLADEVAEKHPWDCAIINWYDQDASLGWHADLSEKDKTKPIVTISLGDACSWAVRKDEGSQIYRTRLESGAVTVLRGETRLWLHTVERIIPSPLFSPLKVRGRISITLRVAT
jgi:alkylated DNA repair protein (DNA oxidative demethylase)